MSGSAGDIILPGGVVPLRDRVMGMLFVENSAVYHVPVNNLETR